MRIHILGICGTFMGSLAILAKQAGFIVSGQDNKVYPPMSTQLAEQGIDVIEGFEYASIPADVEVFIIGNIMARNMPIIEQLLNERVTMYSGPEFLAKYILHNKKVIAVSGTHGKTTTTSLVTHILETTGHAPGYLIGGVPVNLPASASLGTSDLFVIEADEYDCAFFDKRSKFFHYKPSYLIINNIEYDHADIFKDIFAILQQFHYLLRTMPSDCHIIYNQDCSNIAALFKMGVWSKLVPFGKNAPIFNFNMLHEVPTLPALAGEHNQYNMLAALAVASILNINQAAAMQALYAFAGVKRRLELKFNVHGYKIYSDFAHHPTAIKTTIAGLLKMLPRDGRLITIVDLGSNSMKLGIHQETLPLSVMASNQNYFFHQGTLAWHLPNLFTNREELLQEVIANLAPSDTILIMTNGAFADFTDQLARAIEALATANC